MCHPFVGPCDFRHHRVADRIAELAGKNAEYYGINSYFKVLFFGERAFIMQKKKLRNLLLRQKHRAERFLKDFYTSGEMLFCKFCQQNVDWKHVDTYKEHLRSKNRKTLRCTHSATVKLA